MVIAAGSYPAGRWFESDRRYQKRLLGQAVKTSPFHGGNTGSIPVGVTIWGVSSVGRASALQAEGHRFEPCTPHHTVSITNFVIDAFLSPFDGDFFILGHFLRIWSFFALTTQISVCLHNHFYKDVDVFKL